ncbi:MAG TPA: hypothetical protein DCX07_12125 [Phycisphaerales bacterium]|nr:hypothetical protein [Phycisphaerales bacterium]
MEQYSILSELVDLAETLGMTVRRAPSGDGSSTHPGGAIVKLKGREILFLDPSAPVADQIDVVALALRGRAEIENRFLAPELRAAIDQAGRD